MCVCVCVCVCVCFTVCVFVCLYIFAFLCANMTSFTISIGCMCIHNIILYWLGFISVM